MTELQRNHEVHIPVIIKGSRKDGTAYKVKSHINIKKLGLGPKSTPLDMSSPKRIALVKEMVVAELPDGGMYADIPDEDNNYTSYDDCDETWSLDPIGRWIIGEWTSAKIRPMTQKVQRFKGSRIIWGRKPSQKKTIQILLSDL